MDHAVGVLPAEGVHGPPDEKQGQHGGKRARTSTTPGARARERERERETRTEEETDAPPGTLQDIVRELRNSFLG